MAIYISRSPPCHLSSQSSLCVRLEKPLISFGEGLPLSRADPAKRGIYLFSPRQHVFTGASAAGTYVVLLLASAGRVWTVKLAKNQYTYRYVLSATAHAYHSNERSVVLYQLYADMTSTKINNTHHALDLSRPDNVRMHIIKTRYYPCTRAFVLYADYNR